MANFSVNQFRHLYVAKANKGANKDQVTATGDIAYKLTADNKLYFLTKTKGGLLRSDIIDLCKIYDARLSKAADEKRYLKQFTVAAKGSIVKDQEYVLGVNIKNYLAPGEEDTYQKLAVYKATSTTAKEFYKGLAISMALNLVKEEKECVKVFLTTGSALTEVTDAVALKENAILNGTSKQSSSLTGTYTGVVIMEADNTADYVRGLVSVSPINFSVFAPEDWATITDTTPTSGANYVINNGYAVADLEYFCMGERGDEYRNANWPQFIPTEYLVDPTKEYDILNVHYYWEGEGVQVAHSDRDITIVAESSTGIAAALAKVLADKDITVWEKVSGKMQPVTKTA